MADFCKQCSIATFGKDFEDMARLCSEADNKNNEYSEVLCEGCGFIQVNHLGECVTASCLEKHTDGKLFHPDAPR